MSDNDVPSDERVELEKQMPQRPAQEIRPNGAGYNPPAAQPDSGAPAGDLERLRDILVGSQTRTTDRRLQQMEERLQATQRELRDEVNAQVEAIRDELLGKTNTAVNGLGERLDKQIGTQATDLRQFKSSTESQLEEITRTHTAELRDVQRELNARLDEQANSQAAQLQAMRKELSERIEELAADVFGQIRQVQSDLNGRIDQLAEDHTGRLRQSQTEARQRNDRLRQELQSTQNQLDGRKLSRQDFSQMLIEMAQRIRSE